MVLWLPVAPDMAGTWNISNQPLAAQTIGLQGMLNHPGLCSSGCLIQERVKMLTDCTLDEFGP